MHVVAAGGKPGHAHGPYTLYDLDSLPEDGRRHELADGWLSELPGDVWHDHAAERLKAILKDAARQADADVHVAGAPQDVTPRTGNERTDRVHKVEEYAATGIPHYWLVDLEPRPTLTLMELADGRYEIVRRVRSGETVELERPFPIVFDPARLAEME